ncbi:MAG: hypothetical protein SVU32_08015 [Candidatus Nanohaloarchaea archaeon]|nr:hypothetical protein [Candidatus Nanohaloarchaea archaeon]
MADRLWSIDSKEDVIFLLVPLLLLTALIYGVVSYTTLDGHIRFLTQDAAGYFASVNTSSAGIVFTENQVQHLNWANRNSLGLGAVADERLYCLTVVNSVVSRVKPVDDIRTSQVDQVSGRCIQHFGTVDGFLHTHPDHVCRLSQEDRDMPRSTDVTCVQCGEVVVSPTGAVSGLRCWQELDGELAEIEVAVK